MFKEIEELPEMALRLQKLKNLVFLKSGINRTDVQKIWEGKEGNKTTWLTEAFTLHGHDCGHVHPTKIWGQHQISGITN